MANVSDVLAAIDPSRDEWWAKWMSVASACLGGGAGIAGFYHCDYLALGLGIASASAGVAAVIASGRATLKRDNREAFWADRNGCR
jgi:hypothetical protein